MIVFLRFRRGYSDPTTCPKPPKPSYVIHNFVRGRRELKEECGLVAHSLDKVGLITFEFLNDPQLLDVHVFRTNDYSGTPMESEGKHEHL